MYKITRKDISTFFFEAKKKDTKKETNIADGMRRPFKFLFSGMMMFLLLLTATSQMLFSRIL